MVKGCQSVADASGLEVIRSDRVLIEQKQATSMSLYLTELTAIPIRLDQPFESIGQARISIAESFCSRQSREQTLFCLLKIALSQSIISSIKKFPPFLIHRSAPQDEICLPETPNYSFPVDIIDLTLSNHFFKKSPFSKMVMML